MANGYENRSGFNKWHEKRNSNNQKADASEQTAF